MSGLQELSAVEAFRYAFSGRDQGEWEIFYLNQLQRKEGENEADDNEGFGNKEASIILSSNVEVGNGGNTVAYNKK